MVTEFTKGFGGSDERLEGTGGDCIESRLPQLLLQELLHLWPSQHKMLFWLLRTRVCDKLLSFSADVLNNGTWVKLRLSKVVGRIG